MHSPHRTHRARKSGSGRAPGGRNRPGGRTWPSISLPAGAVIPVRQVAAAVAPTSPAPRNRLREPSIPSGAVSPRPAGKETASTGQTVMQVPQTMHSGYRVASGRSFGMAPMGHRRTHWPHWMQASETRRRITGRTEARPRSAPLGQRYRHQNRGARRAAAKIPPNKTRIKRPVAYCRVSTEAKVKARISSRSKAGRKRSNPAAPASRTTGSTTKA